MQRQNKKSKVNQPATISEAYHLFDIGRYSEARDIFSLYKDNLSAQIGLAKCYVQLGKIDLAIKQNDKIITNNPDHSPSYTQLAYLYKGEDENLAIAIANKAVAKFPKQYKVHLCQARILENIHIETCLDKYKEIISLFPKESEAYLEYLTIRQRLKRVDEFDACYECEQIIKQNGFNPDNAFELFKIYAILLQKNRKYDLAIEILKKLIKLDPNKKHPEVRASYAYTLELMGNITNDQNKLFNKTNDTERAYAALINEFPDYVTGKLMYGIYLNENGESKRAINLYEKMEKIKEVYLGLGIAYLDSIEPHNRSEHIQKAIDNINFALQLDKNYDSAWSALGHVYSILAGLNKNTSECENHLETAKKYYNKAHTLQQSRLDRHAKKNDEPMVRYLDKKLASEMQSVLSYEDKLRSNNDFAQSTISNKSSMLTQSNNTNSFIQETSDYNHTHKIKKDPELEAEFIAITTTIAKLENQYYELTNKQFSKKYQMQQTIIADAEYKSDYQTAIAEATIYLKNLEKKLNTAKEFSSTAKIKTLTQIQATPVKQEPIDPLSHDSSSNETPSNEDSAWYDDNSSKTKKINTAKAAPSAKISKRQKKADLQAEAAASTTPAVSTNQMCFFAKTTLAVALLVGTVMYAANQTIKPQ